MASDSKDSNRRGRALPGPAQKKETDAWLLPLVCQSSRTTSNSRTRRGPGTEKNSAPTRLPLLQPRQKEHDASKPGKMRRAKPASLDSPTRNNLSSPPAWSEMDFVRRPHPKDKEEPTLQRRHVSSTTRLEPLKQSALTRLQPLQHSAPQLPSPGMRAHEESVAKEVYLRRGSQVFGSHFAASPSSPSSGHMQPCNYSRVDTPREIRAKPYTYVSPSLSKLRDAAPNNLRVEKTPENKVKASHDKPSAESIDRTEEPGGVAKQKAMVEKPCDNTVKASQDKPSVESNILREEPEVAKQKAISEMHRLFAEESERGGTPTSNAVRALRLLAEAGKMIEPDMSQRSRSVPCSVSAQSSRDTSRVSQRRAAECLSKEQQRSTLDPTVVQ